MQKLNSLLNDTNVPITKSNKHSLDKSKNKDGDSFLFLVLNNIDKNKPLLDKKNTINKNEKVDIKKDLNKDTILNNANFMQLLQLLEAMNKGQKIDKFPEFSNNLRNFFLTDKNIKEIKDAKNIFELINLAKKLDLGLEKIKITKEDINVLKKDFKTLDKNNFFDFDEIALNTITKNKIEKNITQTIKNSLDTTDLRKVLQDIKIDKNLNNKTSNVKEAINTKQDLFNVEILNNKNLSEHIKGETFTNHTKENIEVLKMQPILHSQIKKNSTNKLNLATQTKNKKDITITDYLTSLNERAIKEQTKRNLSVSTNDKTINLENSSNKEIKQESKNQHNENKDSDLSKTATIKDISLKFQSKSNLINHTFKNFTSNLQEKISEYKPPVTRFHMTLSPSNLGEVEVTLINRANNLHININSNNQTMQLFLQNHAEFKTSLINMGFSELYMNFSDQKQGQRDNNNKAKNNNADFENFLNGDDEKTILEVIVPKYF